MLARLPIVLIFTTLVLAVAGLPSVTNDDVPQPLLVLNGANFDEVTAQGVWSVPYSSSCSYVKLIISTYTQNWH
jgi:hypothetical protein